MWELSAPGADAEECFLRLPQTDYYYDGRDTHLNWMPDVRLSDYAYLFHIPLTVSCIISGNPSQKIP